MSKLLLIPQSAYAAHLATLLASVMLPGHVFAAPVPPSAGLPAMPLSEDTAPAASPQASAEAVAATAAPAGTPIGTSDQTDLVVTARKPSPGDPLQRLNAKSYNATQAVDQVVIGPVAKTYERGVPRPARDGLRNALRNLHEPTVFLNFIMQHKIGKAAETVGRFAINSTVGAAGLFDIAKRRPFNLPRRPNGLANTLGFYGVNPGPFFFLPLVGPTTLRDFIGNGVDGLLLPTAFGKPFNKFTYTVPTSVLRSLDHRVEFDEQLTKQRNDAADPYVAARDYYLSRRQSEIDALRGKATP